MSDLYPEIAPHDSGMLDVGDGNRLYWESCGNPDGKPAVFLHGGPGTGCTPRHRRFFDPHRYRIILLDQRGSGRSSPHVGDRDGDLVSNTTWHLVTDLERLREHLGVDRWLVLGGSWGSTLALAYAERHPGRVSELIVGGVFTVRRKELDWLYGGGAAHLFPEAWQRFLAPIPATQRGDDLIEAYDHLLNHPDPAIHEPAALAWDAWDIATMTLRPVPELAAELEAPASIGALVTFARLCTHYYRNQAWLEEGSLLRDAGKLADIPGRIVQGRCDAATPPITAWELSQAWPRAELVMVDDAGHMSLEPGIARELVRATDRFAVA